MTYTAVFPFMIGSLIACGSKADDDTSGDSVDGEAGSAVPEQEGR